MSRPSSPIVATLVFSRFVFSLSPWRTKLGPKRKFLHDDHFIESVFPSDGPVDSTAHVAGDATARHNSASLEAHPS
jgi:hypothetical protein